MKRVLIMGAAGKDFHVFNTCYKNDPEVEVIAFTATQIPNIDDRKYPAELAGERYPGGIPIFAEEDLETIIPEHKIDLVVFAYSDVSYDYLKVRENLVRKAGADFQLADNDKVMLPSEKPVIAICAVRTGCGKSQTTRRISEILKEMGKKVSVVRHPMPYGDLNAQRVQAFRNLEDLEKHKCTIEEMEEYEPHIQNGCTVFAGVMYDEILKEAEKEGDVVLWDGGNNDVPFFKPDLYITVTDPHRVGHELSYYPGKVNFERSDMIVINKVDSAPEGSVEKLEAHIQKHNPKAKVVLANSPVRTENDGILRGKRALVIEDGPTLTHGDMKFGAGYLAAKAAGVSEIIDPRPYAVGMIKEAFEKYSHLSEILPALGYGKEEISDLQETIENCPCEVVVIGTPIDLRRIVKIEKPSVRVFYDLEEVGPSQLKESIQAIFQEGSTSV